jgi:hypothetical protein
MKTPLLLFCLLAALTCAVADTHNEKTQIGHDHFEADFPSGGVLKIHVRPSALHVIGSEDNKIRVHYSAKNGNRGGDVKVTLKTSGNQGELSISGGPRNDFEIEVEVPRNLDLYLRVAAGDVEISRLVGNKDVEVHAGDVTIGIGDPDEYAQVDASVNAGDIDADPFGESKSGLFRSFRRYGSGRYHLHAHVGAGDLTFRR